MKDTTLNMFWAIIWTVILLAGIAALIWKWAISIVILVATIMAGVFASDYIRAKRRK